MRNKKGYFFIIDAIIAILIISIGVLISFSLYNYDPPKEQSFFLSTDIINTLSENHVSDINTEKVPYLEVLKSENYIINDNITILEQIGEFYYREYVLLDLPCATCEQLDSNFTKTITNTLIPREYNFLLIINGTQIYNQTNTDLKDAIIIVPNKKMIHGVFNNRIWGPYVATVVIWQ